MIKYCLFTIVILMSSFAFGESRIHILFPENVVGQGEPVEVKLIPQDDALSLNLQKLKGQKLSETLYLQRISPLMKAQNSSYESTALMIFVRVPEKNELRARIGDETVVFFWDDLTVRPTETKKEFTYTSFSIPARKKILFWLLAGFGILGIVGLGFFIYKRHNLKQQLKMNRQRLTQEFLGADNYHAVVEIWKNKTVYLNEFPELIDHFKFFEKKLFEYQFKPRLNETEMNEVMRAYRDFVTSAQGVLNGI